MRKGLFYLACAFSFMVLFQSCGNSFDIIRDLPPPELLVPEPGPEPMQDKVPQAVVDESLMFWLTPEVAKMTIDGAGKVIAVASSVEPALVMTAPESSCGQQLLPNAVKGKSMRRFVSEQRSSLGLVGGFYSFAEAVTIAFVIRPSGGSAQGRIVSFGAGFPQDEVGLNWNGRLRAIRATSQQDYAYIDQITTVGEAKVVVLSFGTSSDLLQLVVNGQLAESQAVVQGAPGNLGFVSRILALSPLASAADFDLGEMLVYRRKLNNQEINITTKYLGKKWDITVVDNEKEPGEEDPPRFAAINGMLIAHGCVGCHFPGGTDGGGIVLTNYAGVMQKVVAGNPTQSKLYTEADRMGDKPGATRFSDVEKKMLFDWISVGAKND